MHLWTEKLFLTQKTKKKTCQNNQSKKKSSFFLFKSLSNDIFKWCSRWQIVKEKFEIKLKEKSYDGNDER